MDKYIFLDFNGTVLDDVDLCYNLLNEMLVLKGHKKITKERYLEVFQFPIINYYIKAGFTFETYTFQELADIFIKEYSRRNHTEASIFSDVREFVNCAHNKGYKVVLCSASLLSLLKEQLVEFKIDDLFDDVIGLNDYHARSKMEIAKNYVKDLSIDYENSYFIGDTNHDFEVGTELGLKVILVARGHQSFSVLEKTNTLVKTSLMELFKDNLI